MHCKWILFCNSEHQITVRKKKSFEKEPKIFLDMFKLSYVIKLYIVHLKTVFKEN